MITDSLCSLITFFDTLFSLLNFDQILLHLNNLLTTLSDQRSNIIELVSWLYYFLDKSTIITCVSIGSILIVTRIVASVINLIYP